MTDIKITARCQGCEVTETVPVVPDIYRSPAGVYDGVEMVRVRVSFATIRAAGPEGWQMCDPYTHATYCPACWAEIMGGSATT